MRFRLRGHTSLVEKPHGPQNLRLIRSHMGFTDFRLMVERAKQDQEEVELVVEENGVRYVTSLDQLVWVAPSESTDPQGPPVAAYQVQIDGHTLKIYCAFSGHMSLTFE